MRVYTFWKKTHMDKSTEIDFWKNILAIFYFSSFFKKICFTEDKLVCTTYLLFNRDYFLATFHLFFIWASV